MNKIREFRNKLNISQKELAEKCGWGSSRICNYENGFRNPSLPNCRLIVNQLSKLTNKEISFDDVFPPE